MRRLRTLTLTLLPLQVPLDSIDDPTSRIITPHVIQAYIAAAGDLVEAVSFIHLFPEDVYAQLRHKAALLSLKSAKGVHLGCKP